MSSLIRWEPFRDVVSLRERMDRLFDEMGGRGWPAEEGLTTGVWNPLVDVYETKDALVLKADLPEVTKDDVDISVQGNTLTIHGERKREKEVKEKDFYRMERSYGAFSRSFTLPGAVDPDKIEAAFSGGVLTLTLPKREESKPKQIKVKVSGDGK
ncbi:MAG: molecular chaperone [Acidobacteria bacterium RIFCSPLOWO2_12_FULL_60_22]|nr:MAG: molecular chaperone [Acidobacteria bacterium RIFCSPLOWO2_12_FULL_60_22]